MALGNEAGLLCGPPLQVLVLTHKNCSSRGLPMSSPLWCWPCDRPPEGALSTLASPCCPAP